MKNRFFIIVTGWNCEQYVDRCVRSIREQTYKEYDVVFWSDGSIDGTAEKLMGCGFTYGHSIRNNGAALSRHHVLVEFAPMIEPNDIILFLGMDDELFPNALERINKEYEHGKLMTYGNWVNQFGDGLPSSFQLDFPEAVHADRSYRKVKYRSTAPNTFRRFLYDCIKPEDLQYKGEWYKATTESEVMFSCLEQCGKDRIGVIRDPIYLYNQGREDNARNRHGVWYQEMIYAHVINKPKRELWSGS